MRGWLGEIDFLLGEFDRSVRSAARAVRSAFDEGPFEVLAYRGFGNATSAYVYGRAQENRGVGPSDPSHSALDNLMNTFRRAQSRPLPFADLAVTFGTSSMVLKADDEGFFTARMDLRASASASTEWNDYQVDVSGDERNPVFYVSSSPWNIYDVITEFMDLRKVPRGPVLLRDWDISFGALSSTRHLDHKGAFIRTIMQLNPDLPFILLGDTSQHDPEIYRQIVQEFPGRVRAIYIRDVTRNADRSAAVQKLAEELRASQTALVLAEDTVGAAIHAVEQGWINADALPAIREEKKEDEKV